MFCILTESCMVKIQICKFEGRVSKLLHIWAIVLWQIYEICQRNVICWDFLCINYRRKLLIIIIFEVFIYFDCKICNNVDKLIINITTIGKTSSEVELHNIILWMLYSILVVLYTPFTQRPYEGHINHPNLRVGAVKIQQFGKCLTLPNFTACT